MWAVRWCVPDPFKYSVSFAILTRVSLATVEGPTFAVRLHANQTFATSEAVNRDNTGLSLS